MRISGVKHRRTLFKGHCCYHRSFNTLVAGRIDPLPTILPCASPRIRRTINRLRHDHAAITSRYYVHVATFDDCLLNLLNRSKARPFPPTDAASPRGRFHHEIATVDTVVGAAVRSVRSPLTFRSVNSNNIGHTLGPVSRLQLWRVWLLRARRVMYPSWHRLWLRCVNKTHTSDIY
jgi:hypothetical protein